MLILNVKHVNFLTLNFDLPPIHQKVSRGLFFFALFFAPYSPKVDRGLFFLWRNPPFYCPLFTLRWIGGFFCFREIHFFIAPYSPKGGQGAFFALKKKKKIKYNVPPIHREVSRGLFFLALLPPIHLKVDRGLFLLWRNASFYCPLFTLRWIGGFFCFGEIHFFIAPYSP